MRRRLTVTGSSSNIDGSSKSPTGTSGDLKKHKGGKDQTKVKTAVTEFHGISKKGHAPYNPRKKNQDSLIMKDDAKTNSLIFCTLDGHGEHGDHVSAWFRDRLVKEMCNHASWVNNMKVAVADSIAKVEKDLLKNYRIDAEFSGTTLSMAIIRDNNLTGVNIGDSRVILGKEKDGRLFPVEVTIDHKPDSPKEKERILASGGRVFAVEYDDGIDGPPRVWLGHMDVPGLAMSRSLGDVVAHSAGVISEPEFTDFVLDPETDKFIVVATDGLWEFITNQETVDMVEGQIGPAQAVDILVTEAGTRWMAEEQVIDDTTVIVANLFGWKS
mmetsp:Transcript_92864/g.189164  ORF Transcript_92864/g.189164 Transcript_92864/m.189164 type:complete len:327 (+) Transcript_92864:662-1642(+)